MGFSTIAANALSMGTGEYLSSKAHREFVQAEKRRELWEFKHFKDVEIKEVRELHQNFRLIFFLMHIPFQIKICLPSTIFVMPVQDILQNETFLPTMLFF